MLLYYSFKPPVFVLGFFCLQVCSEILMINLFFFLTGCKGENLLHALILQKNHYWNVRLLGKSPVSSLCPATGMPSLVWFLGLSSAGSVDGLDDPCRALPTQDILWFFARKNIRINKEPYPSISLSSKHQTSKAVHVRSYLNQKVLPVIKDLFILGTS